MRSRFYICKVEEYKNNTKKLWQLLNDVVNKTKNRGSIIPYITVDGLKTYNPIKIANSFGQFYSELGKNLASKIPNSSLSVSKYIDAIPRNIKNLVLHPITIPEIETVIKELPNKPSKGHDGISNTILKGISSGILYLLCLIFNKSISEGIFPSQMKMAEVIPLYKGKEMDMLVNYRPISLLITLSKLLEKLVYS